MPTEPARGFQDGFLDLVAEQLEHCRREVSELNRRITELEEQRDDAALRVSQLEELLRGKRHLNEDEDTAPAPVPAPKPGGPIADAATVVALIRESGGPMHYLDIHKTLLGRGFGIGGDGNATTLLSRYSKDPRLNRVARGTYDLADRRPDPKRDISRNDDGEMVQPPSAGRRKRRQRPQLLQSRRKPLNTNGMDNSTFELRFVGLKATAHYQGDGEMLVLRGSQARKGTTALGNGAERILEERDRLIGNGAFEDKGRYFELTRDVEFANPSLAAKVMSGAAKNGWVEWRTTDGKTLSDVYRQ